MASLEGIDTTVSVPEIHSYPKVWALGHPEVEGIFNGDDVQLEEKVDGSQFSMGRIDGELVCRSKGKQILIDFPEKMFTAAIETAKSLDLHPGWIYRCEYLSSPHHNTLTYNRIPNKHIILFDINTGNEAYLSYEEKKAEAERIGIEVVPMFFRGHVSGIDQFKELLNTESVLGGTTIEGIVVKNYTMFTRDKKVAMGKYVNPKFLEVAKTSWRNANPTQNDVVERLIAMYKTDPRLLKVFRGLRDDGVLQMDPRDIPLVLKRLSQDLYEEEEQAIKQFLFDFYWPKIQRGVCAGVAVKYKDWLLGKAFELPAPAIEVENQEKNES